MSIGCFVGPIRASYADKARETATSFVNSIDAVLKKNGLPGYSDPADVPDVYTGGLFGRSALDHHGAEALIDLARRAGSEDTVSHLGLLGTNPYRVAYLRLDFADPLLTDHRERVWNQTAKIWVGSAPRLLAELTVLAPSLGIPLTDGRLSDEVARKINERAPLHAADDCSLAEDQRTAWLMLHEGARLAVQHGVALTLAG